MRTAFDGLAKTTQRAVAWNRSLMVGLVLRKDRASDEHPPRIDEYHCIWNTHDALVAFHCGQKTNLVRRRAPDQVREFWRTLDMSEKHSFTSGALDFLLVVVLDCMACLLNIKMRTPTACHISTIHEWKS